MERKLSRSLSKCSFYWNVLVFSILRYHNGNDQDEGQLRGFGHIGFLVDDLEAACRYLEENGVAFKKKPTEGNMRGLAFAYDPDGYWQVSLNFIRLLF
jgi:catechol 2,3-dioxygenase-like lactoylglutathione lyase family enzyme